MIDFVHSDRGSIRCPLHNQRETFMGGASIQPLDPVLVRYPCGYVDGLAQKMGMEPFVPVPGRDELVQELTNRLKRLEERGAPRRASSTPTPQTPAKKGGVAL